MTSDPAAGYLAFAAALAEACRRMAETEYSRAARLREGFFYHTLGISAEHDEAVTRGRLYADWAEALSFHGGPCHVDYIRYGTARDAAAFGWRPRFCAMCPDAARGLDWRTGGRAWSRCVEYGACYMQASPEARWHFTHRSGQQTVTVDPAAATRLRLDPDWTMTP